MRFVLPRWVRGGSRGRWMSFRASSWSTARRMGGLVGTADDAARFAQMHLNDGKLDGVRILTPDHAVEMRRITARGRKYDLGLGWFVPASQRDANPPFAEHLGGGGGGGFFNVMRIYPSLGVGIVVMGNATKYNIDKSRVPRHQVRLVERPEYCSSDWRRPAQRDAAPVQARASRYLGSRPLLRAESAGLAGGTLPATALVIGTARV